MRRAGVLCLLGCLLALSHAAVAGEPFIAMDRATARMLADANSHAAPTIVALWSNDCVYCKSNLKLFAEMVAKTPGLRLITVAVEPISDDLGPPLDRLAVPGARYAYGPDAPEALAFSLDPKWRGELPRTLFFDGRGGKSVQSGTVPESQARRALGL